MTRTHQIRGALQACLFTLSVGTHSLVAQPTLQITSPAAGTVVNPGQTLTVTLTPSSGAAFTYVDVVGGSSIGVAGMDVLTAPPWQLSFQIPMRVALRSYKITGGGVTASGVTAISAPIWVAVERPDDPVSLFVNRSPLLLDVGEHITLNVDATYSDGSKHDVSLSAKTTYSSNAPGVATIDARGLLTAVAPGFATIKIANGASATFFVSVTVAEPLNVRPRAKRLYPQQRQRFVAFAGTGGDALATWSIDPPNVGSIDANGLYTAPANIDSKQEVWVAASTADGSAEAEARITLYPNVAVAVAPASTTLLASQLKQFTASVANAVDTAVEWSSAPEGAGSIDNAGLYTAPYSVSSPQVVTITATSYADPTKSANATVTINPLPAPTLTSITPASGAQGATVQVTLTGTNFVPGAIVNANNSCITESNVVVVSSTKITATFTIAPDCQGISTPTVTTGSGTTEGLANFTVTTPNIPTIQSLHPASGRRGDSWLEVRVYGTWFTGDMTATIDNPGITIEYVDVSSGQMAFVGLTIATNAPLGPAQLRLTTAAGTSVPAVFTVNQ